MQFPYSSPASSRGLRRSRINFVVSAIAAPAQERVWSFVMYPSRPPDRVMRSNSSGPILAESMNLNARQVLYHASSMAVKLIAMQRVWALHIPGV